MISVEEAKQKITQTVAAGPTLRLPLAKAKHHILAEDIVASLNLPPFRQSAMDGYAVNFNEGDTQFEVVGEISAGSSLQFTLQKGQAVRIFTGAAVPSSANAVVMQEWIDTNGKLIALNASAKAIKEEMNIRPLGEQIKVGDIAITKGSLLNAGAAGIAQSFGIQEVEVYSKPQFSIVVTGDEIVSPGQDLPFGSIYESNSITLSTAIEKNQFPVRSIEHVHDSLEHIKTAIQKASESSDIILISGGISVGDYDFVHQAMRELNVQEVFYKIAQKPGKPVYFGTKNDKLYFALPGNPASALVCMLEYALPAAQLRSGNKQCFPTSIHLPLINPYTLKGNRSQYLKARLHSNGVEILHGQASSMIHAMIESDALVYLEPTITEYKAGDEVEVHLIQI